MLGDQRFWLLVSLKLSGEINEEELRELEDLIRQNPSLLKSSIMLQKLWETKKQVPHENKEKSFDKHLQRLSNHLSEPVLQYENIEGSGEKNQKKTKGSYVKLWWAGAVAASLLLCWVFITKPATRSNTFKLSGNTINAKPGFKMYIVLPDGSKVWLNADSKLTYGDNFQGRFREVYLSGEAFFDVTKDKDHPFIIHTKTIDVKVLGTAFNVRSYENEETTETALVHGSVEVTLHNNPDKKIILRPSEKLIVKNNMPDSLIQKTKPGKEPEEEPLIVLSKMRYYENDSTASVETSWVKNRLVFDKEPLKDIALKIERWYNVRVIIKNDDLNEEIYTASFEDESLEQVMEALKLAGNFRYTIKKKEVIIRR
jgi:ferric-dicitrate binding protein FerR (iron transport regulator)